MVSRAQRCRHGCGQAGDLERISYTSFVVQSHRRRGALASDGFKNYTACHSPLLAVWLKRPVHDSVQYERVHTTLAREHATAILKKAVWSGVGRGNVI